MFGQAVDKVWLSRRYGIIMCALRDKCRKIAMFEFALVFAVLALVLGGYWALVIFPKQRAFQHKQKMARSLHVGDEIVTFGGMVGKIVAIDADTGIAQVEIADGVTIRLLTAALQQVYDPDEYAYNANIGIKERQTENSTT